MTKINWRVGTWSPKARHRVWRIYLAIFTAAVGWSLYATRQVADDTRALALDSRRLAIQGKQAHDAACGRKARLRNEITQSKNFLKHHPKGIPSIGITRRLILDGINDSKAELKTLKKVVCVPGKKETRK